MVKETSMYLTGFADEAAEDIDGQIKATRELGWRNIEARSVDGENINDIPDEQFEAACAKFEQAGVKVNCLGSVIANWSKQVTDPFEATLAEVHRAIGRMRRLGAKFIRIMSYAVLEGRGPDDQMEQERFRRLREVSRMFTDAGLVSLHENCMNYGGMGRTYTLKLVENAPGLKLVFDTGNPVSADDRAKDPPYPKQSSWDFYSHVREHIAYVHIKDGVWDVREGKMTATFAGEGDGDVKRIVKDLLDNGYDDGFSMEPHLSVVFHDSGITSSDEVRYANYVEYGRRFMKLIEEIGHGDKLAGVVG